MKHIASLIAFLVIACHPLPPDNPDPKPDPSITYGCSSACERQRELGCEVSTPTAKGALCAAVCLNTMEGPPAVHWDVACMSEATNCGQCE